MQQNQARRAAVALGIFMAIVLVAGAILPLFSANTTTTNPIEPTIAPTATFPPPITDFTTITFDQYYLHPTGLFAVPQPPGWDQAEAEQNITSAVVNMTNQSALSVIDMRIEQAFGMTTEELDAHFTEQRLADTWRFFSGWEETNRRLEEDRLLIDFVVTIQRQRYVARQIATTDGRWIYSTRVLAPENATAMITYLVERLPSTFIIFDQFADTPVNWLSYYDPVTRQIIRFPETWSVADSAPGRLASISGTNGEALRVYQSPGTQIADESAAQEFVENARAGAVVLSVVPVTRGELAGYSVAYTFTNADGEAQSGLAVLLNGEGTLHAADLYFPARDVDLNTVETLQAQTAAEGEATPEATGEVAEAFGSIADVAGRDTSDETRLSEYATVMSTFGLLPPLNLSPSSLPPATPTLVPTPVTGENEGTPEVTGEAETTAEPTETVEETPESASTDAAEATGEVADATAEATAAP